MVCAVCLSTFLWICDMAGLLVGTFVSWWYLPRIWPSATDMQHYYHALLMIETWDLAYVFTSIFSVEVCLVGVFVFPQYVSTWRKPCVRVYVRLKLIWRHLTYKMPVRYILSSLWVRFSMFSQLSIIQYMGLCVFSLPISHVKIETIYISSYYHQIGMSLSIL